MLNKTVSAFALSIALLSAQAHAAIQVNCTEVGTKSGKATGLSIWFELADSMYTIGKKPPQAGYEVQVLTPLELQWEGSTFKVLAENMRAYAVEDGFLVTAQEGGVRAIELYAMEEDGNFDLRTTAEVSSGVTKKIVRKNAQVVCTFDKVGN